MIGFPRAGTPSLGWSRAGAGPAFARDGMIAAAHPLTVETGLAVLKAGGNAVDAAVAAALTAAVVMPEMCGLGGDLFAIVQRPGEPPLAFLGSGAAPRGATLEQMKAAGPERTKMPLTGPLSIGVPGMVHAYGALLERFGNRAMGELATPAIRHAKHGFAVTTRCAAALAMLTPHVSRLPKSTVETFLPGGRAPSPGQVLRQPALARTLETMRDRGVSAFYRGELADRIAAAVLEAGGALCADDLGAHETTVEAPIASTYRGYGVHQTGLPSQGMILLEALNIIENANASDLAAHGAAAIHLQAEAIKLAYADRLGFACDPATRPTPLQTLISKPWGVRRWAAIDPERAAVDAAPGSMSDGDTTYLCVVDSGGMMVSLIQSVSSAFGSLLVAGDTGVLLNNRVGRGFSLEDGHPNQFAPGRRPMNTLNCWLVTDPAGAPLMVGGTPGGDGQPQWNLQMLSGLVDAALDVQQAVELPRWSIWPGTDPHDLPNAYELRVENRIGEEALAQLERQGHVLRRLGPWGAPGAAQIVVRDPASGVMAGGSDPRAEGMALGF